VLEIFPVKGLPDISKGDSLARLISDKFRESGNEIRKGDIVIVAQKIVSKAEGRTVSLSKVKPSLFASEIAKEADKDPRQVEVILRESTKIVRMKSGHLITQTKHGFVCANSGVDMSNVAKGSDTITLLPVDPDKSATTIRSEISRLTGQDVPVIITDTFGRAWRLGHVNFAIGVSGMKPIRDYRGTRDMFRHLLRVTEMAVADELAAAAELVMNKADKIPVAIVRGYPFRRALGSAKQLVRPEELDLFR
jgi:coenzyme F420-0:L-glutamate ligase / coenzyme F420-1:gamma-L-glutamate ligase